MLERISPERVRVQPGLIRERMDVNIDYLMALDSRALLLSYTLEAAVVPEGYQTVEHPEESYFHWGWEAPTCQLRGHFLGHWMSAAAHIVQNSGHRALRAKLYDIVDQLRDYQLRNGGAWVGPIPEKYFDLLAAGRDLWSPQYTMHKLLMGLLDAYRCTGYAPALTILSHLGDWYIGWVERTSRIDPGKVYRGEAGGMLEIWVGLYRLTGEEKYQTLIHAYDSPSLITDLEAGRDPLSSSHANASIPWVHGVAKLYEITRKERYLDLLRRFWDCAVTERGMYATTGASAGEFWVPKGQLGAYLGDRNQEFCTVYNMVRLADALYRYTGEMKYADYIERALYNGFLAQQNRETGMPTYFLPLSGAAHKKWGSLRNDFWCCHGTMVQAQASYPSLIYYRSDEGVSIAQYIPSRAELKVAGVPVVIELGSEMKYAGGDTCFTEAEGGAQSRWIWRVHVRTEKPRRFVLSLRLPGWMKTLPQVSIGGERRFISEETLREGALRLDREWSDEEILLYLPTELAAEPLADAPERVAVTSGPVVLAALGEGITLDDAPCRALRPHSEHTYGSYPWLQDHYRSVDGTEFVPLYEVTDEAYTVYQLRKR